ncbi:hypothetical protein Thimo_2022 [Thioflavicoccus mobilis 8321]|uniref:Uncharacterized protein n=1 Tax=Thioflavicoccus mobilis 8321 TaxID=765912 RepID=L0GVJ0_9GAMM|nr:hypothetical protein [Thioflavicoccus mobilis]AGA90783.1 hypothetical protein Thimo_2022 [Thioflavicoccus mobilis 8321]
MGVFRDAFKKIGDGIQDAASLDVVTFKGAIEADLTTVNWLNAKRHLEKYEVPVPGRRPAREALKYPEPP